MLRFIFFCLLFCNGQLHAADIKSTQAAYASGVAYEKSGNYVAAADSFKKVLDLSPNYFWASRELGNCNYFLQHYSEAASDYGRYVSANPTDKKAVDFLNALKEKLNQASITGSASLPLTHPLAIIRDDDSGFNIDLFGSIVGIGSGDIKSFASNDNPGSVIGADLLWNSGGSLALGYFFKNHFNSRLGFSYGPMRSAALSQSTDYNASATLSLAEWAIMGYGGWRYAFNRHTFSIELGAGPAFLNGNYSYKNQVNSALNSNSQFSSFAWAWETQIEYEFRVTPQWGLCLDFGYHIVNFNKVTASGRAANAGDMLYSDGNSVSFNDSGPMVSLGVRWLFVGN